MKINNSSFNEWLNCKEIYLEKDKYFLQNYQHFEINNDYMIGLMVQYLLDNGYDIGNQNKEYLVYEYNQREMISSNADLFTALKQAIESIKEYGYDNHERMGKRIVNDFRKR